LNLLALLLPEIFKDLIMERMNADSEEDWKASTTSFSVKRKSTDDPPSYHFP
jgi:hypothetical protein